VLQSLRTIKWLAQEPAATEALHVAGAFQLLVPFLCRELRGIRNIEDEAQVSQGQEQQLQQQAHLGAAAVAQGASHFDSSVLSMSTGGGSAGGLEVAATVLFTLYSLCRVSRERQEAAAKSGIVPLLRTILSSQATRFLEPLAAPLLCDLAHAGSHSVAFLVEGGGVEMLLQLLRPAKWSWHATALNALAAATTVAAAASANNEGGRRLFALLSTPSSSSVIAELFITRGSSSEALLPPLTNILEKDRDLAKILAGEPAVMRAIRIHLEREIQAVVIKHLLSFLAALVSGVESDPNQLEHAGGGSASAGGGESSKQRVRRFSNTFGICGTLRNVVEWHGDKVVVVAAAHELLARLS
jgi:hypothetical protein